MLGYLVLLILDTSEARDVLRHLCAFGPKNTATPFVDYAGCPEHPSQAVSRVCSARFWAFPVNTGRYEQLVWVSPLSHNIAVMPWAFAASLAGFDQVGTIVKSMTFFGI